MSTLSVVVPVYNKFFELKMLLDGWARQTDPDFELIIVNDGGDDFEAIMGEYVSRIRNLRYLYLNPPSKEFRTSAARNFGLQYSTGQRILNTDGDCIPASNLVEQYKQYEDPKLFVLGHRYHCNSEPLYRLVMKNEPVDIVALTANFAAFDSRRHKVATIAAGVRAGSMRIPLRQSYNLAWSCHINYDAELACQAGGWDPKFTGYGGEDLDFSYRMLKRCGVSYEYRVDLSVYHVDHPSTKRLAGGSWQARTQAALKAPQRLAAIARRC